MEPNQSPASGAVPAPQSVADRSAAYLRKVGIDPNIDTRTPVQRRLARYNAFYGNAPANQPPPPPGSNPAAMTGENPTFWEYAAGIGDALVSSAASSTDQIQEAIPKYVHDFMLNHNIPLWDGDDKYRAEVDGIAAAEFGGDKNKAQLAAWERFGRKKFEETRARFSALGVAATAFDFATGAQTHKAVNDGLKYAMETTSQRLQNRSPVVQEFWATELAGTVGGTAPYLALAAITGGYGVALSSGAVMLAQSNEAYTEARQKGASFEDAIGGGAIAAAPAAASGVVSKYLIGGKIGETLAKFQGRWNKMSGGKLEKMMDSLNSHVVGRLTTAGAAEGFQELVEQLFVKFGVAYATDQELLELEGLAKELAAAGKGGAEAGVFFRALTEAITKGRARGDKGLSPKVGDEPVFDEETGEMRRMTQLTNEQAQAVAGSLPSSLAAPGGVEPEPQKFIDAQFVAMTSPETAKDAVFVAKGSPQPTTSLLATTPNLYSVPVRGAQAGVDGVVYTQNPAIAQALTEMSATAEGVTAEALDQILYGMAKGKPTGPDAKVVQRKDADGNIILSRATAPEDIAAVTAEFERQLPKGTTSVVTPEQELVERIQARRPDVKSMLLADKYFNQAVQQTEILPRDVPVNELAAIIAAEEKLDIGIATVVAREVRGRLDQGIPTEPKYDQLVTIDATDPRTWPKEVSTPEAAAEMRRAQQSIYARKYEEWLASQGPTPEQEAQRRLEATVGGPQTEKDIKTRKGQLLNEVKKKAERLRLDSKRSVGGNYRQYQDEIRQAELLVEATERAEAATGGTATERDITRQLRELTTTAEERRVQLELASEAEYEVLKKRMSEWESSSSKEMKDLAVKQEELFLASLREDKTLTERDITLRMREWKTSPEARRRLEQSVQKKEYGLLVERMKQLEQESAAESQRILEEQEQLRQKTEAEIEAQRQEFLNGLARLTEPESKTGAQRKAEWTQYFDAINRDIERNTKNAEEAAKYRAKETADFQEALSLLYGGDPERAVVRKQFEEFYGNQERDYQRRQKSIQAEIARRKLAALEAEELQAALLPEAEQQSRKDEMAALRGAIEKYNQDIFGVKNPTEAQLEFEQQIAGKAPQLVAERDEALAEAQRQRDIADELDRRADQLDIELDQARANYKAWQDGVRVQPLGRPWMEVVKQLQSEKEAVVREYGAAKANQIEAEQTAAAKLKELQTLEAEAAPETDVGEPEPLPATPTAPAPVNAAKGKYNLPEQQAGVVLAQSMPTTFGGGSIARQNFLKRMLQVVAQSASGVTVDELVGQVPKGQVDVGQRKAQVLENLGLMEEAGLLVRLDGPKPTYSLTLDAAQKIGQQQQQAAPAPEGPSFGRARTEGAAASFPAAGQPAKVGDVPPGKSAYQYRLEAALLSSPYLDLEMYAPDVRLEAGAALETTAQQLAEATDEQLNVMLRSGIAVGLEPEAVETKVDPVTGIPTVVKTQPRVVALPTSTTSVATWIAHRTLAQGELRRRAAALAAKGDKVRSDRAAARIEKNPSFGKPRMSYDALYGADSALGMRKGQPIVEMGDAPGFEGASLTGTREPTLDNPPTKPITKIDLRAALMDLANAVVAPIVAADTSGAPYVGRFDVEGVIRTASTFNFHVTGHEIGHALTARVFGEGLEGVKALDTAMPPAVRAEMEKLGKLVYPSSIPTGGHLHEGFAEFVMGSIIRPEAYNAAYPESARFLAELMQANPDIGKAFDQAATRFQQYRFQGFAKVGQAAQIQRGSKSWRERVKGLLTLSFLEREFVNAMVGTRKLQNQAIKNGKKAGLSKNELDRLRVNDLNEALAAVNGNLLQTWMSVGMTDGNGNIKPGSQSLNDALAPMRRAAKEMKTADQTKDFSDYLYAKRAIALYESDRATVSPDGIEVQRENVRRLEAKYGDAIKLSHQQFMQWWSNAIDYVRTNDPFFAQVFDSISKYEEASGTAGTYVPLQRVIYDLAIGSSVDTGLADVFDVRRATEGAVTGKSRVTGGKLVGSPSPVYDVLQESEASLQALLTLVHKRMAIRNVVNVAQVMRLPGYVVEITDADGVIPEPMTTASGRAAKSLLDVGDAATVTALREMGLNAGQDMNSDDRVILDFVDLQDVTTTTPDGRTVVTKQPIKRRYSISKDVAIAIGAMKPQEVMQAWRSHWALGMLQGASNVFKLGATGLNVGFQLISAPIMDFGTTFLNGTQPWCGMKMLIDYPLTYMRLAAVEAGIGKYAPYEQYKLMAGSFDSPWSATMNKSSIQYVMMTRGQRAKHLLTLPNLINPSGDLWRLAERKLSFGSRVGRMLEMEQALKRAGYKGDGPISQEQMVAATVALRRVTTNWGLAGRTAGELNRYIPYFNVSFVTFRDFFRNASKQMGDPRTRIQYGIKMAGLMGLALAYWRMAHDDDDPAMKEAYQNASYEDRLRYWIFGYKSEDGSTEVLRIPNPMTEFLPAKLLVATLDGVNTNDPYAAGNYAKAFISSMMPSLMPQFVQSGLEAGMNVNDLNKFMLDKGFQAAGIQTTQMASPMESAMSKGPLQERVTPYTTETGMLISQVLGGVMSPRQADHLLEGFIGGASDTIASLVRTEGPMTPTTIKQAPGYGTFAGEQTVGRLISKTGPITMRSPKIQELAAMYEMAQKRKDSTRQPETLQHAAELQALKDAWGCVSALNYISQYHESLSRADRQQLMREAVRISEDVTGKMLRNALAMEYKTYDMPAKKLKQVRDVIREQQQSKTPGYQPSIDFSKILR